jgi:ferredoxin
MARVCTGHGLCRMTSPTVFVDNAEGYGQVIGDGQISREH